MTALLTADEAAALRVGVNVIVRPGELRHCDTVAGPSFNEFGAPPKWVALTGPCLTCDGEGRTMGYGITHPCERCAGTGRRIEPLYTDCPKCHPFNGDPADGGRCQTCGIKYHCYRCNHPCNLMATGHGEGKCENHDGRVLVGRGSIEVVPVVGLAHHETFDRLVVLADGTAVLVLPDASVSVAVLTLNPLPVPGRDFGIVIDCVEVA